MQHFFCKIEKFQSTLPARGATQTAHVLLLLPDFNPRSPHGERHLSEYLSGLRENISIHAPRTGSDRVRRAGVRRRSISIHAPRTGSDIPSHPVNRRTMLRFQSTLPARGATGSSVFLARIAFDFNPRSPHGERRAPATSGRPREPFQSTLPARGATVSNQPAGVAPQFQSTLPARGATVCADKP